MAPLEDMDSGPCQRSDVSEIRVLIEFADSGANDRVVEAPRSRDMFCDCEPTRVRNRAPNDPSAYAMIGTSGIGSNSRGQRLWRP